MAEKPKPKSQPLNEGQKKGNTKPQSFGTQASPPPKPPKLPRKGT